VSVLEDPDVLKVRSQWVSPVEVESNLVAHPAVLECAVVGQEDADGLVKSHSFVALRPEVRAEGLEEALKAHAREKLAPYKCPR
jgi:benzoate-CoA ligase